jgi:hypothetical protein
MDHGDVELPFPTVEVLVSWGTAVLHVAHLTPPRPFYVGESWSLPCDVALPPAILGAKRAPVVLVDGEAVRLLVLPGAEGTVTLPGRPDIPLRAWMEQGEPRRHEGIRGAYEIGLPRGARVIFELGGVVFQVTHGFTGGAVARGLRAKGVQRPMMFAAALHLGLLAGSAFAMPRLGPTDTDDLSSDSLYVFKSTPIVDGDGPEPQEEPETGRDPTDPDRGQSCRCRDEEGSMGDPASAAAGHRYGVAGPADNPDPHLARRSHPFVSAAFTFVPMIGTDPPPGGAPHAPTAPWGRDDSLGNDPRSARGNMWGETIDASFGRWGTPQGNHGPIHRFDLSGTAGGGPTDTERAGALPGSG